MSVWALFLFVFTVLLTKIFLRVWVGPSKPQYSYMCLKSQAFAFTITSAQGVVLRAQVCSLCASHTVTVQHAMPYECCRLSEPCRAAPSQLSLGWAAKHLGLEERAWCWTTLVSLKQASSAEACIMPPCITYINKQDDSVTLLWLLARSSEREREVEMKYPVNSGTFKMWVN